MIEQAFPATRMRRLRQAEWNRRLVAETRLAPADLIWPLFIIDGTDESQAIEGMPDVERLTIDRAIKAAKQAWAAGIACIALFPYTPHDKRRADAAEALNPDNLVCRATRAIKDAVPEIGIMCDVALDPYTDHGHDGLLQDGEIVNDATLEVLVKQSLIQAAAGCDIIAPSDMMDGRVAAIRTALEAEGKHNMLIMAYAAKYASSFYAPFRHAIGSANYLASDLAGDKRSYQMDYANSDEALREIGLDLAEGADMVMVKPCLPYLDIIRRAKDTYHAPLFAYQVSGEYAMLAHAIKQNILPQEAVMESLLACKRAGANGILTYFALHAARQLNDMVPNG